MAFKIYTKTGDKGTTSLFGGTKLPKSHIRIASYGALDELNAHLGLINDLINESSSNELLINAQNRLFDIGSSLASDPKKKKLPSKVNHQDIERLEEEIDRMTSELPELQNFILPGGSPIVSHIHIARTVARRAERNVVALRENEFVEEIIIPYLNRLSDYLFTLARYIAMKTGVDEVTWTARPDTL